MDCLGPANFDFYGNTSDKYYGMRKGRTRGVRMKGKEVLCSLILALHAPTSPKATGLYENHRWLISYRKSDGAGDRRLWG
jgi:hypothetical protein